MQPENHTKLNYMFSLVFSASLELYSGAAVERNKTKSKKIDVCVMFNVCRHHF